MILSEYKNFLDEWLGHIKKLGIDVSDMTLDHLGYAAESGSDYNDKKEELLEVANLAREVIVSGRRVGVFELKQPLMYKDYSISAVELLEPIVNEAQRPGFEHAEFTTKKSFANLISMYPNLNWDTKNIDRADFPRLKIVLGNGMELKFNLTPILE